MPPPLTTGSPLSSFMAGPCIVYRVLSSLEALSTKHLDILWPCEWRSFSLKLVSAEWHWKRSSRCSWCHSPLPQSCACKASLDVSKLRLLEKTPLNCLLAIHPFFFFPLGKWVKEKARTWSFLPVITGNWLGLCGGFL